MICAELERLDINRNNCLTTLNETCNDLINIINNRKNHLERHILNACELKNRILNQQLEAIELEKTKVRHIIYVYTLYSQANPPIINNTCFAL